MQSVISDAVASQRLRHPVFMFSLKDTPHYSQNNPMGSLEYQNPRVLLKYPPEWKDLAGTNAHLMGCAAVVAQLVLVPSGCASARAQRAEPAVDRQSQSRTEPPELRAVLPAGLP